MAKKGQKRHLKRFSLPPAVMLPRKLAVWASKPRPGPHRANECLTLRLVVRDYLDLARTARETDRIITGGQILVDGKTRRDPKFPVGLMDVVQVPEIKKNYRVLYDEKGRLTLHEISQDEASFKLCMVIRKSVVKGGRTQLAFHDGKTSIGEFGEFKIQDVAKLTLPDFKVEERLAFGEGMLALITGGSNVGKVGRIQGIRHMREAQSDLVTLKSDATTFQSPKDYVFLVGREKPMISLLGD